MEDLHRQTLDALKMYNIKANKSLGQNFLISEKTVKEIVRVSDVNEDDLVIEVGPGIGSLTNELIHHAGKVICVELDEKMINILNDRFKYSENVLIIHEDILKVNLQQIIDNNKKDYKNVKIVANLPYYITTPIIMKLLEEKIGINSITVMIQKEVADRLTALPGDELCGAITVAVNYYSVPKKVMEVSKENFIPVPEVDSTVIKLDILKKPVICVESEKLLFKLVKIAFGNRRKTLLNNIYNAKIINDKTEIKRMLEELEIGVNRRGETLKLSEYEKLTNYIFRH